MAGHTNNRAPHGGYQGGRQNAPQRNPQKSFTEYYDDVKQSYFGGSPNVLDMGKTDNLDDLLSAIEHFVQKEGVKVSTSQLRNVYDCVIKAHSVNEMKMIRPKLAYIAGRGKDEEKKFLGFIDGLIKTIETDDQRANFKVFFESVIAYHKFYSKIN
jgi:CRISPR type III-A-associated protein Csm2